MFIMLLFRTGEDPRADLRAFEMADLVVQETPRDAEGVAPTSALFNKQQVEEFYSARGVAIVVAERGVKRG